MRLLSMNQYPDYTADLDFKEARIPKLISGILALVLAGTAFAAGQGLLFRRVLPKQWCFTVAAIALLWAMIALVGFVRSGRTTNWLLRIRDKTIWIKFRSFRNQHFSPDEVQIVELELDSIQWIRRGKVHVVIQSVGQEYSSCQISFLELGLRGVDTAALAKALGRERRHAPVGGGNVKTRSVDTVAWMNGDRALRVRWRTPFIEIRPGVNRALEYLGRSIEIKPPVSESLHFTWESLKTLPEEEQKAKLRELASYDEVAAIALAGRLLKCSQSDARIMLKADV